MNKIKKRVIRHCAKQVIISVILLALGVLWLSIPVQSTDNTFGSSNFLNKFLISDAIAQTDNTQAEVSESEDEEQYYTYMDGDTEKYIVLRQDLVMERYNPEQQDGTDKLPPDAIILDDGQRFRVVKKQSWHQEGDENLFPVFSSFGGVVMVLTGGVFLVFESKLSQQESNTFFAEYGIDLARVSLVDDMDDVFFIDTNPGLSSLELANKLAKAEQVIISVPNWWSNDIQLKVPAFIPPIASNLLTRYAHPCFQYVDKPISQSGIVQDPRYSQQWHLTGMSREANNTSTVDIQVKDVKYKGEGIIIGVIDTATCLGHEDLRANISEDHPSEVFHQKLSTFSHGTQVSGIIAAAENNIGGRGVAPEAKIFSMEVLLKSLGDNDGNPRNPSLPAFIAIKRYHQDVAVYNNSWGKAAPFIDINRTLFDRSEKIAINEGFKGKGSVYVWSAGNDHCLIDQKQLVACGYDNSNYDPYLSSYAIISVCAVNDIGVRAPYSEMGANLWICAPSQGWRPGHQEGIYTTNSTTPTKHTFLTKYNDNFSGTSAAAPQVSGVVALMREANDKLTWRDVKLILAATAEKIDENNEGCNSYSIYSECNGNGEWLEGANKYGSGLEKYSFNHQYGFGLVNAKAAIELAENWTNVPKMGSVSSGKAKFDSDRAACVGEHCANLSDITINTNDIDFIEYVEIELTARHPSFSDLSIRLRSPSGFRSELAVPVNTKISGSHLEPINNYWKKRNNYGFTTPSWRFGSARHLGEDPNGNWRLEIIDKKTENGNSRLGDIKSWDIKFYGHDSSEFSSDANLADLTLLSDYSGKIDLNFSPNRTRYTVNVDHGIARVKAMPDPADSKARIIKNTAKGFINLSPGQTRNIEIEVTAQDGTKKVYTIAVTRAVASGQSNELSGLSLSDGVSLNFRRSQRNYRVNVANNIRSIRVTPTAANSATRIEVDGRVVLSGRASNTISLQEGLRTIRIVLTTGSARETYHIEIIRAAASVNLSDDATLQDLRLSDISLNESFSSNRNSYTADVGSNSRSVSVIPTANHRGATITVDGSTVASGRSQSIRLNSNQQTIRVAVTSEDGGSVRNYTIAVTRAQSSDADLISLSLGNAFLGHDLSSLGLAPAPATFSPSQAAYLISIYEGYTSLEMHLIAKDPAATITINGKSAKSGVKNNVDIKNTNIVSVKVISGDRSVSKEYLFAVIKLGFFTASHLAPQLNNLMLVEPSGERISLEGRRGRRGFDPQTSNHDAEVDTDVRHVTVTPVVRRTDGVQITINGETVASGNSIDVALEKGDNTITVVVTLLAGGNNNIYTIEVERAYSGDATLSSLRVIHDEGSLSEEIDLEPPFYSGRRGYKARVGSDIEWIEIFPQANDSEATIRINNSRLRRDSDSVRLNAGDNDIEVEVEAENGDRREYSVEVWRGSADDATLSSLKLSGGVNFERERSRRTFIRTSYRIDAGSNINSVIVTPIANDPAASVTIVANGETVGSGQVGQAVNLNEGENTITINVVSKDGNNRRSYTIRVDRASGGDVSLRGYPDLSDDIRLRRSLSNDSLFTGEADYDTSHITVEIDTNDTGAHITINDESVASGEESSDIPLNVGVNIITVRVVSNDRSAEKIYTIIVPRLEVSTDHDSDDDNLIEIRNLEQLYSMRYELRDRDSHAAAFPGYHISRSCDRTCIGYELMADLDFNDDASYQDLGNKNSWTSGEGWPPIDEFNVQFDGNGYSIRNLYINRSHEDTRDNVGLFSKIDDEAHIRNIGIINARITGVDRVGALVGENDGGKVSNSYATGTVTGDESIGGLIGLNYNNGIITGSYATVNVSGDYRVGGLVGQNGSTWDQSGTVSDSYATGSVSGRRIVGGLVGDNWQEQERGDEGGVILNSYAIGRILGIRSVGGLVGLDRNDPSSRQITHSYWDTNTTQQIESSGGTSLTTVLMISPTSPNATAPSRYTNWDTNKWYFGNNRQYPAVRYYENCEQISSNNPYNNEGDSNQPDCGDLLPGQRAHLIDLGLSGNTKIQPSFNRISNYYVATISTRTSSVELTPTASDSTNIITIKEDTATTTISNGGTYTASLNTGNNLIDIVVTSQDGSMRTYTIKLLRTTTDVDYDTDNDNLIEIAKLEQLDAIRYDLDGNGISDDAINHELYQRAYPGFSGCADSCKGYELTTDLDFDNDDDYREAVANKDSWTGGEGWQPIGEGLSKAFGAIFEGNGYTISNLFIDRSGSDGVALFGQVASNARIRNIGLIDIQVTGRYYVGGLIGRNYNALISDSYATGSVSGEYRIGGLIGYSYSNSTVSNSYTSVSVIASGRASNIGGLIGVNWGIVVDSYASGSVVVNESDGRSVGGLVGSNYGTINSSYASGSVVVNGNIGSDISGLVGYNRGTINNSYASGRVVINGSRGSDIGGLVGYNDGTITNSYTLGSVVSNGSRGSRIGGLVGYNGGTIANGYATGDISGFDNVGGLVGSNGGTVTNGYAVGSVSGYEAVGGLIGHFYNDSNSSVKNSYAVGKVTGSQYVGGLIANTVCSEALGINCTGAVASYWNTDTTRQLTSDGGIALTTEQMITPTAPNANNPSRYSGWTTTDWDFGNAHQYPAVRYAGYCETVGNNIYRNEGDIKQPDCGDLLPGQHTYLTMLALSDDTDLFPTFNRSYRDYTANVDVTINSLSITPTAEAVATIRINGTEITSGASHSVSLRRGSNIITISIVGQDGSIDTYRITILRATQTNHDADGDSLIEINTLEQLNAIRYDSDGDGNSDIAVHSNNYIRAYPGFSGCSDTCIGYELVSDLDFQDSASYRDITNQPNWISNEGWQPIVLFNAIFEGNNHTISNLFINREDSDNAGLFAITGSDARIRNINLSDVRLIADSSYRVGGLIGFNHGTVSNSNMTGNILGFSNIGGLIGENHGMVSASYVEVNVQGSSRIGGLIGRNKGMVSDSYATGSVFGNVNSVGGLIGENHGTVSASYAEVNVQGSSRIGGLIGESEGMVSDSYATGSVFGDYHDVGGLIGQSGGMVSDSYATGNVSGDEMVGGLIGDNSSTATSSYATGSVFGTELIGGLIGRGDAINSYASGDVLGIERVGGLIGSGDAVNSYAAGSVSGIEAVGGLVGKGGNISNSYATGNVSGEQEVGGLIGNNVWGEVSNSYAMGNVSGTSHVGGVVGDNAGSRSSNEPLGAIFNSYAIGRVTGTQYIGGLVGSNVCVNLDYPEGCSRHSISAGTITASYWNSNTSGQTGNNGGTPLSTSQLVTPTAPNAVRPNRYSDWDLANWHFGNNEQYPAVRYAGHCESISNNDPNLNQNDLEQPDCGDLLPGQRYAHLIALSLSDNATLEPSFNRTILNYTARVAPYTSSIGIAVSAEDSVRTITINGTTVTGGNVHTVSLPSLKNVINISVTALDYNVKTYSITVWKVSRMNYDTNGNNLIEIKNLQQLSAMRYDLNGDGISDIVGNRDSYLEAFVGFSGCSSDCIGYELASNLDFQNDDDYKNISNKSSWTSGRGWLPISQFTAIFDGNENQISNLFINRKDYGIGLFNDVGEDAHIRNVRLINVQITGRSRAGGLIGRNSGTVSNSYVEGEIEGEDDIGGLIGYNGRDGVVSNSYVKVNVSGHDSVGGLVGENSGGDILGSYATGNVSGQSKVGGLVGNGSGIVNSYATANVTGRNQVGGLAGTGSYIENSYAIGPVQGERYAGGLVGEGTARHSYWNIETSGQSISGGGIGLSELDMTIATMPNESNPNRYIGWDTTHWHFGNTQQYPALRYVDNCEHTGSNINLNEDTSVPDCGDLLPGQRDVSLIALSLSNNVRLSPAFNQEITEYRAQVLMGLEHLAVRVVASNDVEEVTVNGKPVANESLNAVSLGEGDSIITIVVVGGRGAIAKSYVITLTRRGNSAPRVNQRLTDQIAEVGEPFSYAIPQNTFLDADGDSLIYYTRGLQPSIDPFSDDGITFDPSDNTFSGIPGYGDASQDTDEHIITVGVNDRYGGTTESSFMLFVNSEPTGTVDIEADITKMQLVGRNTLDDANGGIVDMEHQWQKEQGNDFVNIRRAKSLSYLLPNTKKARAAGNVYRLNTLITDGIGEVSGFSTDYVLPNWAPRVMITRSTQTIVEGDVLFLEVQGSDPNLDKIKYNWQQISGRNVMKSIERRNPILEVPISAQVVGKKHSTSMLVFAATVRDKEGSRSSEQVSIILEKIDNGQVAALGSPIQDGRMLTAPPIDLASDIDGEGRVTGYQWQVSTDSRVTWIDIADAGTDMNYIVPLSTTDSTEFRVSVSYEDGQGHSRSVFSRAVTYALGNNQPIIDLPVHNSTLSIMSRASTDVRVVVSDADVADVLTVTLNVVEGGSIIESTPTSITVIPNSVSTREEQVFTILVKRSGSAKIRIELTDDSGVSANSSAEPVVLNVKTSTDAIRLRVKVFLEGNLQ